MKNLAFLRIFRVPNLLMILLALYLMRWSVLKPLLGIYGIGLQTGESAFLLLVLSTLLISAAGYVINDYHDARADQINKPEKLIIDLYLKRRPALLLYGILNLAGVACGITMAIISRLMVLSLLFAAAPFIIWLYSVRLKRMLLAGSLTASLLTGSIPLLVILAEYPLLREGFGSDAAFFPAGLRAVTYWVVAFSFFAFLTAFISEIIKGIINIAGDKDQNNKTFIIRFGLQATRRMLVGLVFLTMAVLSIVFICFLRDPVSLAYLVLGLLLPLAYLAFRIFKAKGEGDFRFLMHWIRIIMLTGLLYAPVASMLIRNFLHR